MQLASNLIIRDGDVGAIENIFLGLPLPARGRQPCLQSGVGIPTP
jgi:hypothetical protein